MGAEQSQLEHVPGFNPDITARKRRQPMKLNAGGNNYPNRRQLQAAVEWDTNADDVFFSHVTIEDHISPIYEGPDTRKKEALDEGINGVVDLSKLLDELDIKGKGDGSDSDGDLMDFPDYGDGDDDDGNSSDATDDDERGLFHHEREDETDGTVDMFSGDAHPLAVKGDCCVAETIKCQDLSEWRNQFPVYKTQWFLGIEVGNQVTFKINPECEGSSFLIPVEAIGRYIQVVTTRRVENQIHDTYQENKEGGVYDAHVQRAQHLDMGSEKTFTDVRSTAVVGPVLISDSWSYIIMNALRETSFQCAVKLRDEILESEEYEAVKGKVLSKVPAVLTIMNTAVEFSYVVQNSKGGRRRNAESSSLFSPAWLKNMFGKKETTESLEEKAKTLSGEVAAQLRLKTVSFRPCSSKRTIVLATKPRKKGYSHTKLEQDLIRFDPDPQVGRELLLHVFFAFQAAQKYKLTNPEFWGQAFDNGEVDQGKELVQRYIEYLAADVEAGALAYEEMPLNPWDY